MTSNDIRSVPRRTLARGVYLITPDEPDTARLLDRVVPVLPYASCLQYRNKTASGTRRLQQADGLRALCSDAGVPLIVNDDAMLAASVGADGVHLGEHDGAIATARALLGSDAIIGMSCYDSVTRAVGATAQGADYIAFGTFFDSPTKPLAPRASLDLLRNMHGPDVLRVAIGGITPDNAPMLIAAGADLIAVISGVFDAADPVAAVRAFAACFDGFQPRAHSRHGT